MFVHSVLKSFPSDSKVQPGLGIIESVGGQVLCARKSPASLGLEALTMDARSCAILLWM